MWDWVTQNRDNIELFLALFGFGFIWYQIIRTRNAAEASKHATNNALKSLSQRFTLVDLSSVSRSMGEVQTALRGHKLETAVIKLQDIREQLVRVRHREGFATKARQTKIQSMVVDLARLQSGIEKKLSEPETELDVAIANDLLAIQVTVLSEWGELLVFSPRSRKDDS